MAQLSLTEFRQKYPQYQGKSDGELAEALHRKFYSTIPREEFDARLGLVPGNPSQSSPEFEGALADASARSQFAGVTPVTKSGPTTQSDNMVQTGLMENIGAGVDSGANKALGAPIDLPVWLGNSVVNAANSGIEMTGNGRPIPNIPNDLPGSSQGWERLQESLGFTPPNKVIPGDTGQAVARAAAEATTMAAIPEALAIKAGQVIQQAPRAVQAGIDTLEALFGRSANAGEFARNMTINAAAGGGAQAAMEASPDEWKPVTGLAGGLTAATAAYGLTRLPEVVQKAVGVLGDYLGPLSKGGQERAAGQVLRNAATSPGEVIDAIETAPGQFVTGSQPTTVEMTGDQGLAALAATKKPEPFARRAADQNAARVAALEGIQPTGAPEEVVTSLRSYLDDIERQADEAIADATSERDTTFNALGANRDATVGQALGQARASVNALGGGLSPVAAGAKMRELLDGARAQAKTRERALWNAVDPDGNLTLAAQNTKSGAARIRKEMPGSAKPMSGEESAIFATAAGYSDSMPFSELTALQSRLKAELRAERLANGESPAYRRLSQLNTSIQQDLEAALVARVKQEAQAVADGTMSEMDTIASRLQSKVDTWYENRQAGAVSRTGSGPNAGRGSAPVPSARGTGSEAGGRPPVAPGNQGLPQDAGTAADAATIERLNAARAATRARAETFDNPTLAPIHRRPDDPAAAVPGRIFTAGAKAPEAIARFRAAVGDEEAIAVLRDYAIDRFNKTALNPDGTLDTAKATAWLRQHSDALQAFPELNSALRDAVRSSADATTLADAQREAVKAGQNEAERRLAAAAKAERERVAKAQAGILGRLIGLSDPEDITRAVGSIFGRQDSNKQMERLAAAIGGNAAAREGMRKAVADHIVAKFVNVAGDVKGDAFQTFITQHRRALELAGFSEGEIGLMGDLADDLQRANRAAKVSSAGQDLAAPSWSSALLQW